ncbi:hypothetical protein RSAG8_01858, partial [Rhizoctonia solani AG-8 WAC10335]
MSSLRAGANKAHTDQIRLARSSGANCCAITLNRRSTRCSQLASRLTRKFLGLARCSCTSNSALVSLRCPTLDSCSGPYACAC